MNNYRKYKDSSKENKIIFGVVGSGWRSEFYLRVAKELSDKLEVCGLVTRNEEKGTAFEKRWGIKTYMTIDDMLKFSSPDYVVVTVAKNIAPSMIEELANRKIPVLAETPPAPDLEGLIKLNRLTGAGTKIQVAEQYHLQPMHAARIAVAQSGKLGEINQVQVSFSHGYHGVSLIRKLLGVGFENTEINGFQFISPVVAGPGREGLAEEENMVNAKQEIAILNFGSKLAIYDFQKDQHRCFVRAQRILIRGTRGEINNSEVRYLKDFRTPIEYELMLKNTGHNGNMEGYFIKGVIGGEEWVYINPFIPGKLSDEEIAVASCLEKMYRCVKGGPDFYSLAEASQDQYIALMINKAIITGEKVVTENQPWVYNM
jgi:hypothetical protein